MAQPDSGSSGAPGRAVLEPVTLTLLQLDVATSFDLRDPAVVNGPRGLWNRHGSGSVPLPSRKKPQSQPPPWHSTRQRRANVKV